MRQRQRNVALAGAYRRLGQGPVDDVALRVAAADLPQIETRPAAAARPPRRRRRGGRPRGPRPPECRPCDRARPPRRRSAAVSRIAASRRSTSASWPERNSAIAAWMSVKTRHFPSACPSHKPASSRHRSPMSQPSVSRRHSSADALVRLSAKPALRRADRAVIQRQRRVVLPEFEVEQRFVPPDMDLVDVARGSTTAPRAPPSTRARLPGARSFP